MPEPLADRTLPHNLEAERAVLGAVLLDADAWPVVAAALTPGDFFRDAHTRIVRRLAALAERGVALDLLVLREALAQAGDLDEVGGPAYLAALVDGLPHRSNVAAYAAIVREKARLREVIAAGNKIVAAAYADDGIGASAVIDHGVSTLQALADVPTGAAVSIGDAVLAYATSLDAAAPQGALPTGFADLDTALAGGLRPGLTIVAGRPSAGKTSLGLGMAVGLAKAGHPAVVFSLEMEAAALASRVLSWEARVPQTQMDTRMLGETHAQRIGAAVGTLQGVPLHVQDSAASLLEVGAWCARLKDAHGLEVAVIDYLQLLAPERRSQSREADVAAISRGLARLAKTQQLAVVALSQLNRSPEGRKDNRPRLSDLRESGALEQDAAVALLLFRAEQYERTEENRGIAEVIVAKNRSGATGVVRLCFIAELGGQFANLAPSS